MINFNYITNESKEKHNSNWPQIPDHPYRILIIGDSGSGKTNSLFNLIYHQPDTDKPYLHVKDSYEAKYQFLINKRKKTCLKHFNDSKAFIEYPKNMDDIYKNIEKNYLEKRKILFIFYMLNNKELNTIVTEVIIRGRKLNLSLAYYIVLFCSTKKYQIKFCAIFYHENSKLQQIAFNNLPDIDFKDFMNLYKRCTAKPFSFLVIDTTLASDVS